MARTLSQPSTATLVPAQLRWSARGVAVTVGLTLVVAALLLGVGDVSRLFAATVGIITRPALLAVFVVSYAAAFVVRGLAWRVLLPSGPGVLPLTAVLHIALLANHLFPTKAGELLRVGLLVRRGVPVGTAAGSTALARLLDFVALVLIALVAGPLAGGSLVTLLGLLVLPLAAITGGALVWLLLGLGYLRHVWPLLPAPLARIGRATQTAVTSLPPARIALAFPLVLTSWLLEAGALWTVAQAAGAPLTLTVAVAATAFTIAFQGMQVTPGGIGVYEASLTAALALYGVDPGTGLSLAIATHTLKFAYSYVAGPLAVIGEGAAMKANAAPAHWQTRGFRWLENAGGRLRQLMLALLEARRRHPLLAWPTDPWLLTALVAVVALPSGGWEASSPWLHLLLGAAAALPLLAAARLHHLPRPLWPLEVLAALGLLALFGVSAPFAGFAAAAVAGVFALRRRPLVWANVLWPATLTQATAGGGEQPLAVACYGLAALIVLVLARQWWLSHQTLPAPRPLQSGDTLAVLLPVLNEAATVGAVVARIPRQQFAARGIALHVIVVDDGSADASAAIAAAAGADQIIRHPQRRGLGAALRTGMTAARQHGAAAAVYLDADGEYDPADIPAVAAPVLRGEADYVLGVRSPLHRRQMCRSRRWGNRVFTFAVSVLTGRKLADAQTGFRAFSARALEQGEILHDYNYAQVLTLDLLRKRMRMAEVPIGYRIRQHGVSFIRYRQYLWRVLPAMAQELLRP